MNILVANDDGINAEGLRRLVESLSKEANIYVCAPDTQRSCASHSICMHQPISIRRIPYENAVFGLVCTGTPVDCVKLGIKVLMDIGVEIDMVFAGINHGSNIGVDTIYSGTLAAAVEGSICGKKSVAVSVTSHEASHFDYACKLAVNCIKYAKDKIKVSIPLSINVPDIPETEIKGVKYVKLGKIDYMPWFIHLDGKEGDEDINLVYRYGGKPVIDESSGEEYDVVAVNKDYATITPVTYDMTSFEMIDEIKKWGIDKC